MGRQDIKWSDVQDEDLVIVQTPDTNRLAMGGIPITSISGNTVTTKSGFLLQQIQEQELMLNPN